MCAVRDRGVIETLRHEFAVVNDVDGDASAEFFRTRCPAAIGLDPGDRLERRTVGGRELEPEHGYGSGERGIRAPADRVTNHGDAGGSAPAVSVGKHQLQLLEPSESNLLRP